MCLLALAWHAHPRYPLIFAGNRDEFRARPADAAHWWTDNPDILAGRDLEAGGTWLGLRRDGRFAVVTNFREPDRRPAGMRSRGELVSEFLASEAPAEMYFRQLGDRRDRYAGFNLLFGDALGSANDFYYFSNRDDTGFFIRPGIHALSNHLLDTPWPKVRRLRECFIPETKRHDPDPERFMEFLDDRAPAPAGDLPDTGLSPEWEARLSAPHVTGREYGTRASTVVMVGTNGHCLFVERRFDADDVVCGETREHFEAS